MKLKSYSGLVAGVCMVAATVASTNVLARGGNACSEISWQTLQSALQTALGSPNGGLNFDMWVTLVDRSGRVCHVASADGLDDGHTVDPWPGSRVISAQKANTANAFSNEKLALSTANLYSAVQPGGSLFGLQFSNPVDTGVAYRGNGNAFGKRWDPMRWRRIGGVNVFGGGVPLYYNGQVLGAIGVSGDTSCADHNIAWKTREALKGGKFTPYSNGVAGVGPEIGGLATDDIIFDSKGGDGNDEVDGFEHADNCPGMPLNFVPNVSAN